MNSISQFLTSPSHYLGIIQHYLQTLELNHKSPEKIAYLTENGLQLATELAEQMDTQNFAFDRAKQSHLRRSRRKKLLYTFSVKDLIVLKAMLAAIAPTYAANCPKNLYSYIRQRSVRQPINRFCAYSCSNLKQTKKQIYIYKTDFHHFYETIPVHHQSSIWHKLDNLLIAADPTTPLPEFFRSLYIQAVRPEYLTLESRPAMNLIGIPYGSPFSGLVGNLYGEEIDRISELFPQAFYARYSDDILIASFDREMILDVIARVQEKIQQLGFIRSNHKEKYIYLSKSGLTLRHEDKFKGSNTISYLGCVIHANGNIHSTARKINQLLFIVKKIIDQIKISFNASLPVLGKTICQTLKKELFFIENRLMTQLFLKTNDHQFLANLDKRIALLIAESLTGILGHKAFRQLPYHTIRDEFGLPSLIQLRNAILI